jgi:hypothetical protein
MRSATAGAERASAGSAKLAPANMLPWTKVRRFMIWIPRKLCCKLA